MPKYEMVMQRGSSAPGFGSWESLPKSKVHQSDVPFGKDEVERVVREAKSHKRKSHRPTRVVIYERSDDGIMVPSAIPWSSDRNDKNFRRPEFGEDRVHFGIMGPG